MSYRDWFDNYSRGEIRLIGYFRPPEELTADRIPGMDRSAADLAKRAEALLENLAEYRNALAARYASLSVMPYRERLELERRPTYNGPVYYDIRIVREYEDGTKVKELSETYPGKQRREALSRFEELRRARPGIEAVQDISRRAWEK